MTELNPGSGLDTLDQSTPRGLYRSLAHRRWAFLQRAWKASALTIPTLFPERGQEGQDYSIDWKSLPTPWQGLGAMGVNSLSAKFLLSLFPPATNWFRLTVDDSELLRLAQRELGNLPPEDEQALQQAVAETREQIETDLAGWERQLLEEFEVMNLRVPAFEALKHLVCVGNVCMELGEDEESGRIFKLDQYVADRDPWGNLVTLVVHEQIDPRLIDMDMQERLSPQDLASNQWQSKYVDVYTAWRLDKDAKSWEVTQQLGGTVVELDDVKVEDFPFIVLRGSTIAHEAYGRSIVDEYIGDLQSLEGLAKSIVEGAAASAKVLFLVDPTSSTRPDSLAGKPNGAFVRGRAQDVQALQVQKQADMAVAANTAQSIGDRLSRAFLLHTSVQRDAERVTAQEVRVVAQELEDQLGGMYSVLTQELQMPLVRLLIKRLKAKRALPPIADNEKIVRPAIVTGLDAIGRGHDLTRLQLALQTVTALLGPEATQLYINPSKTIARVMTSSGVDPEGIVRSEEEVQQIQQAQAQANTAQVLTESVGSDVVRAASQAQQGAA